MLTVVGRTPHPCFRGRAPGATFTLPSQSPEQAAGKPGHSTRRPGDCPLALPDPGPWWARWPADSAEHHTWSGATGVRRRQGPRGWGPQVSGKCLGSASEGTATSPPIVKPEARGELWGEADGRNGAHEAGGGPTRSKGHTGQDVCPRRPAAREPSRQDAAACFPP